MSKPFLEEFPALGIGAVKRERNGRGWQRGLTVMMT
jgi:hypothetical protein